MKKYLVATLNILAFIFCTYKAKSQSYVPQLNDTRMIVKPKVPIKAYSFNLTDVQLLPSPFKQAMQKDSIYLLSIEPDRLLSGFLSHSGLKPKGALYDGWESSGLAGHTLGHYLSALSMAYASSHSPEFLKRVNYIVEQLIQCQLERKTGYIGAIPNEDSIWSEVKKGHIKTGGFDLNGGWSPWYTVHKLMAGLLDAYLYCGNKQALIICEGLGDWTGNTINGLNNEQIQKMLVCEYGGMAESLANLYAITGKGKYLALSYKFYDTRVLDLLADKQDNLAGKHSNTQIPKILGSARRYELTGNKKDSTIASFFWQTMTNDHSYANGGNGNYEYLGQADKLNDNITDNTIESCATYNMLKLTRHLFAINPTAAMMDYYENALYNDILASQNHENGMMCYFVPLRMGGKKEYSTPFTTFTCCVGTGMENHVKYNENIFNEGDDGSLYVNIFIPSVLNWKEKAATITQTSNLPSNDKINLKISTLKSAVFKIRIRKPRWTNNYKVAVNGQLQTLQIDKQGYLVINRKWKNNDKVEITFPEHIYTVAMPDNSNRDAVFYGPDMLAGELGTTEPDPLNPTTVFVTGEADPNKWLAMVDKKNVIFKTNNTNPFSEVTLIPFNQTEDEHYTVYWDVFTPATWAIQQKAYDEAKKKQLDIVAHTTDIFRLGEMQPERDHDFTGEHQTMGEDHLKKWRSTDNGGFLSYVMKIDPSVQNTLINTYWGDDNRGRIFDILIDGVKLTTQDLNNYKESRFYNISYQIPIALTKGKNKVTIKLVAKDANNSAGPVYGSRMIKE